MKKWLKVLLISLGSIVGLLTVVFSIVSFILFTPSQLTPIVNRFANEFLNAKVKIESVDLAYFSVYPFVRLNIENVLVLDQNNPQDTLTFIPSARAKLNFNDFVFRNNLIITQLELNGSVTNVTFHEDGTMNWDIFPASEGERETTPTPLDSLFNTVDIKQIVLNSGHVNYRNEKNGQVVTIYDANFQMNGSFIEQNLLSEMSVNLYGINFSDGSMGVQISGFQTTLNGDLFNSQVHAISDIVIDSLRYSSETMNLFFPHLTLNLESTTNFSDGQIHIQTIIEKIHFDLDDEVLLDNSTLSLALTAEYFSDNQKISIEKGALSINEIPFHLSGTVEMLDTGFYTDLSFNLDTTRFSQIYELLPEAIANMVLEFAEINDGDIFCNGTISGKFANGAMPNVNATFGIKNMSMVVFNSRIDTLNLLADASLRLNDLRNATLTVRDFYYSGHLGTASVTATVRGFSENPYIETHVITDLNLRRLYRMLVGRGNPFRTRGAIHADINAGFALQDVLNFSQDKLDRIRLDGVISIDDLLVRNRQDSINLFTDFLRLRLGAQVEDERLEGQALFRANLRLDSLDFVYRNQYTAQIARLSTGLRIEMPTDDDTVNIKTARISFRDIRLRMPQERIRLNAGRTSASVRIVPNPDKPTSPLASVRVSADAMMFRQPGTTVRLGSSQLNLALMPQVQTERTGGGRGERTGERTGEANGVTEREGRGGGGRARYAGMTEEERRERRLSRLAVMSSDELLEMFMGYLAFLGDTNIDIAQQFMNDFSYEGSLVFDTFRLRMSDFPMPISVLETEVNLTPRLLSLDNAKLVMGNTDMKISGGLENFRRALAGRGTLRGQVYVNSNKIDGNQLMLAMRNDPSLREQNRGGRGEGRGEGGGRRRGAEPELNRFEQMDREREARRAEREASGEVRTRGGGGGGGDRAERAPVAQAAEPEYEEDPTFMAVSDSVLVAEAAEDLSEFYVEFKAPAETSLFMIPRLLNIALNLQIDTFLFGGGTMTNLHGTAEVRDEFLRLNEFRLTNGAGELGISLAYKAHSLNEASVWMEMNMENTEIQDLLELYPAIKEELAITQSLEGLVSLNVTLSSVLDSTMNVDLDRTVASASMHGENLVLLDGETFSTVANLLGFRRRDQNLIDSISVSATVKDGVIEVFPFKLTMNRYSLAVGGTQGLDGSFNYHVTFLNSPFILFRPVSWGTSLLTGLNVGINASGTPPTEEGGSSRMRIRPTRADFRDLATPATSVHVQRTINVQYEFRQLLDRQLGMIVGEPTQNE